MKIDMINNIHNNWINPNTREIWIHGVDTKTDDSDDPGIEYQSSVRVIKNLHLLRQQSEDPVTIHLYSPGGSWDDGMAMYDTIISMPYYVTMINYPNCASMASVLFQAADNRVMMPSSYMMIHYGSEFHSGNYKDVMSNVEYSKKCMELMLDIYEKRSNLTQSKLKAMLDKKGDVYISAVDSVKYGLADAVFDGWK